MAIGYLHNFEHSSNNHTTSASIPVGAQLLSSCGNVPDAPDHTANHSTRHRYVNVPHFVTKFSTLRNVDESRNSEC